MKKTTARILITTECPRSCSYCCNTKEMLDSAIKIQNLEGLDKYSEICLSGGEPLLFPDRVDDISRELRERYPKTRIFLYTTMFDAKLFFSTFKYLDGVCYTVHSDSAEELEDLAIFQLYIPVTSGISFRLNLFPEIQKEVTIIPARWSRILSQPWKDDCPLPAHEDLFILEENKND